MELEESPESAAESSDSQLNATSFINIIQFLSTTPQKYPDGFNVNQRRTLRKAAANFEVIDQKLYYTGKLKKEKRLVIMDSEGKERVFRDCHGSAPSGHWGQKKTLEKIESLYFWRGMVKDVVAWVQACTVCQQKEEKRLFGPVTKKIKLSEGNSSFELSTVDMSAVSIESTDLVMVLQNARDAMKNMQLNLNVTHQLEEEIVSIAQKADHDIDEGWDNILANFIKMVTKQKRLMKEQVEKQKNRALIPIRHSRKQLESRIKATKKFVTDTEAAVRDSSNCHTIAAKSASLSSSPEIPHREDIGSVHVVFTTRHTEQLLQKIVSETGHVLSQSLYRISGAQQCPAALRLSFDIEEPEDSNKLKDQRERRFCPKELRVHYCQEGGDSDSPPSDVTENVVEFTLSSLSSTCYLNGLEPHVMYSIYVSHKEEGSLNWSAWSLPYIASTSVPAYSWDASNGTWMLDDEHCIASKILSTSTPLYSSAAQYFPGCRLTFTILDLPETSSDDGVALVEQWVQGGALCQEGTIFLNALGQLFIDGKFCSQLFGPLKPGVSIAWDAESEVETAAPGLRLNLSLTIDGRTQKVQWNLKGQISNVYFGALFVSQGTRVQIE